MKLSVPISQGIIFRCYYKSLTFSGSSVYNLTNIDQILGLTENPSDFIIVSCSCIDHDVFVSVKEHKGHFIVQFVHGIEIWNFGDIDYIESYEFA